MCVCKVSGFQCVFHTDSLSQFRCSVTPCSGACRLGLCGSGLGTNGARCLHTLALSASGWNYVDVARAQTWPHLDPWFTRSPENKRPKKAFLEHSSEECFTMCKIHGCPLVELSSERRCVFGEFPEVLILSPSQRSLAEALWPRCGL